MYIHVRARIHVNWLTFEGRVREAVGAEGEGLALGALLRIDLGCGRDDGESKV